MIFRIILLLSMLMFVGLSVLMCYIVFDYASSGQFLKAVCYQFLFLVCIAGVIFAGIGAIIPEDDSDIDNHPEHQMD